MKTYAELNRENQQLKESLQLTETMLETERENRKVLEERLINTKHYVEEHTDKLGKTKIPKIDFNYCELTDIIDGKQKPGVKEEWKDRNSKKST